MMKTKCAEIELLLSARLDGEATASQWVQAEEHMASCARCSQAWQSLQASTNLLKTKLPLLQPSHELWSNISARLEMAGQRQALPIDVAAWLQRFIQPYLPPTPRALRLARFGFVVLVLALAGLPFIFDQTKEEMVVTNTPAGRDTTLAAATLALVPEQPIDDQQLVRTQLAQQMANYLEETRLVLLEVKNSSSEDQGLDLHEIRRTSQSLLERSVLLKADLKQEKAAALQNLVEQLELVLLELANVAEAPQREEVEMLRAAIRQNDLLIKIEIIDLKALERPRPPEQKFPAKRRPANKMII